MEATNILTMKGTTTIPAPMRRAMRLATGSMLKFHYDHSSDQIVITKVVSLQTMRAKNQSKNYHITDADIKSARGEWMK
jgi:bifunctional DNA-binding transcriptional regulator/antitoxin component of YhaV-PrlF toxin-antitoxin module